MASITITVNGEANTLDLNPQMPLLWVLRDVLGLTGTKYSCGIGMCGSCTVHVEGKALRSCITPLSAVEGKHITTIEGLSPDGSHPLQKAWVEEQVSQCGYCQPGQIMTAAAFLAEQDLGQPEAHPGGVVEAEGRQEALLADGRGDIDPCCGCFLQHLARLCQIHQPLLPQVRADTGTRSS